MRCGEVSEQLRACALCGKGVVDGGAGACLRRVGGQEDYLGELGDGEMEMGVRWKGEK